MNTLVPAIVRTHLYANRGCYGLPPHIFLTPPTVNSLKVPTQHGPMQYVKT